MRSPNMGDDPMTHGFHGSVSSRSRFLILFGTISLWKTTVTYRNVGMILEVTKMVVSANILAGNHPYFTGRFAFANLN